MGNYAEGLAEINTAFNAFASSSVEVSLYDYNVTTLPGGIQGPGFLGPGRPDPGTNIENPFHRVMTNIDAFFSGEILMAPEAVSLFGPTDIRFTTFFVNTPNPFSPPFSVSNFFRRVGALLSPTGVNIPDLYLLRAECKARLGDLDGAIADVEFFKTT